MSTVSAASARSSFTDQVTHALVAAGATVVVRCPICLDWHAGACPFEGAGEATPFVATISNDGGTIDDGVLYEGSGKPQFVQDDDRAGVEL